MKKRSWIHKFDFYCCSGLYSSNQVYSVEVLWSSKCFIDHRSREIPGKPFLEVVNHFVTATFINITTAVMKCHNIIHIITDYIVYLFKIMTVIHVAVANSKFFRTTCFQTCQVWSGLMSGILLPTLRRSSVWSLLPIFRDNLLITFPLTLRRSRKLKVAHSTHVCGQFNQLIIMFTFAYI